jgi:hypothetical protein
LYFHQAVDTVKISPSGVFFLGITNGNKSYQHMPFHHTSTLDKAYFYFNPVWGAVYLPALNSKIQAAFPSYSKFQASTAYTITWSINVNSKSTLVQVALCTDNKTDSSFMIVNFAQLDVASDTTPFFYVDTALQVNTFHGSVNGSNCGVPGQFIFQLNSIDSQTCLYFLFYLQCCQIHICSREFA